jgi:hypothetical protein
MIERAKTRGVGFIRMFDKENTIAQALLFGVTIRICQYFSPPTDSTNTQAMGAWNPIIGYPTCHHACQPTVPDVFLAET